MTLPAPLSRFLAWWLGELWACLPAPLRRRLGRGRRRLLILLRDDSTLVLEAGRGPDRILARAPVARDEPGRAPGPAQAGLADTASLRGPWSEILAVIPPERALCRRLQLPAAVAENLSESMGFEIDRLTPFTAAEVFYQARLISLDRRAGQLSAELWVVPRAVAQEGLQRVAALGFRPDRIGIGMGVGEGDWNPEAGARGFVDLPLAPGGKLDRWLAWRLPAAAFGLAALLALAAFFLHLERKDRFLEAYGAQSARYRGAAAEAAKLRQSIASLAETQAAAAKHRREIPLFVDLLAEVTARLPDDTWLTELRLADGHVLVTGYAASAAALVSVMEDSPLFQNARLSGPVIPDASLKREQFSIDAEISPKVSP
jgi:general secretion pathway protein L